MTRSPQRRRLPYLALAGVLALACASPEERFARHVRNADEQIEAGKFRTAVLELRAALKIEPENVAANERLAELLLEQGAGEAEFYFREVVRIDRSRVDAAMRVAQLRLIAGDTAAASELIQEALAQHADAASVQIARSDLALAQKDFDIALAAATRATEIAPEDPLAWAQRGKTLTRRIGAVEWSGKTVPQSDYDDAVLAFTRADDVAGGSVTARVEKARILGAQVSRWRQARAAHRSAVVLAQVQGDNRMLGLATDSAYAFAVRLNKDRFRRWVLQQMVVADPGKLERWDQLARLDDELGANGSEVYAQLLALRPGNAQAHLRYSAYLAGTKRRSAAIAHLEKTISSGLDSPLLWEAIIRLRHRGNHFNAARQAFALMAERFPDAPITLRAKALIALAENRPRQSVEILRSLPSGSQNHEAQRLLAFAELRAGNLANAAAAIDRAIVLSPGFAKRAMQQKAEIHAAAGEWAQAIAVLRRLVSRGHQLTLGERYLRARALYEMGQGEPARAVLDKLLAEPHPPPGAAVLYAEREDERDPDAAMKHLEAAAQRAPRRFDLIEAIVELQVTRGDMKGALERLDETVAARRVPPQILLLRGRLLARTGNFERAEADVLRAFEVAPGLPGAGELLFSIYRSQGRLEEARRSFEEAEEAGVLHSGARMLLGHIYVRSGEDDKARSVFEKVLADNPFMTTAKNDLAFLLAVEGEDLDRALRLAEEAQQARSSNPNAADTVGYVYYRKGLHEAALQQFRYAIDLSQEKMDGLVPILHYHLGLTLHALGRDAEAAAAFETALGIDADFRNAEDARRLLNLTRARDASRPSPS